MPAGTTISKACGVPGAPMYGAPAPPGLALSFALASVAADAIRNTLFGVSGRDPLVYLAVGALVAGVSLAPTFVPARLATRVDPMHLLRMQ